MEGKRKNIINAFILGGLVWMLAWNFFNTVYFDRNMYRDIQSLEQSLIQDGMPKSQVKVLRSAFFDVSRHVDSLVSMNVSMLIVSVIFLLQVIASRINREKNEG